jgi:arylsulfatase A-like enzyme
MALRVDRLIGKLLDYANAKVGAGNVLVVLTGDHGVAPLPELMAQYKMPNGRFSAKPLVDAIENSLTAKYGEAKWVLSTVGDGITLNREPVIAKKLEEAEVERTAAAAIERMPFIYRVYTREELLNGIPASDPVSRCVVNGFYPSRSADLIVIQDAFSLESRSGTSHSTVWGYDRHVPLIFMGPGIKAGRYDENATPYDIASTLATMLNVETPSGSIGRVLAEMLVKQ